MGAVEYTKCFSAAGLRLLYECPGCDTKQSDDEVLVTLELWGMRSTPSLLSLPDSVWHGVMSLDRFVSMGQIELNNVLMLNWIV